MSTRQRIVGALGLLCAVFFWGGGSLEEPQEMPRPTEHVLDEDAEARNKAGRKKWMEEMHRAAPDVEWREIERRNGLAEMARRRAMAGTEAMMGAGGPRWTEIGSRNLAGRMRSSCIGPDGEKLYAGSALGGLWRGELNGTDWVPLGDNHYGGVNEVVILDAASPGAPDVFIVRSGDDLYRSEDDGASWVSVSGLPSSLDVRDRARLRDVRESERAVRLQ